MNRTTRREFLRNVAVVGGAALVVPAPLAGCRTTASKADSDAAWARVPDILARIQAPSFPDRDFVITEFGAERGASRDATEAIARAVRACADAGGGRAILPAGGVHPWPLPHPSAGKL